MKFSIDELKEISQIYGRNRYFDGLIFPSTPEGYEDPHDFRCLNPGDLFINYNTWKADKSAVHTDSDIKRLVVKKKEPKYSFALAEQEPRLPKEGDWVTKLSREGGECMMKVEIYHLFSTPRFIFRREEEE